MSSALETNSSAAAVLPSTLQSVPALKQRAQTALTVDDDPIVDITFTQDSTTFLWKASSSDPAITIAFAKLDQITWNLIVPDGVNPATVFFDEPPISFPSTQAQAPMVVINAAAGTKQLVALWANVDFTKTGTYAYTVNMFIAGQGVTHDPTVENIPPTI